MSSNRLAQLSPFVYQCVDTRVHTSRWILSSACSPRTLALQPSVRAQWPVVDGLPAGLAAAIADRYGIVGTAVPILDGGDECRLWRLDSIVVRLSPQWRTVEELAWTHRVAAALGASVPEVTRPVPAIDGTTAFSWQRAPVSVWPFVDGIPLDREEQPQRARAARLLGRLHRAAATAPPMPDRPVSPAARAAGSALPDPALDAWLQTWRAIQARHEPSGVLHGDYYRRNILCRAGQIVGLLDWDDARSDLLITELAWATWELAKSPDGTALLVERAADVAAEYRRAGGPARPSAALVPLIREHLRYEVDRAERARLRGEPIDDGYRESEIVAFHALRDVRLSV